MSTIVFRKLVYVSLPFYLYITFNILVGFNSEGVKDLL